MGNECLMHHSHLAQQISIKKGEQYAKTNLTDQNQKLIRTLGICVSFVLEALGQEECHVTLPNVDIDVEVVEGAVQ